MNGDDRKGLLVLGAIGAGLLLFGRTMGKAEEFIRKALADATQVGKEFNLPVWLILTQAAHESAYGVSGLTVKAKNLFGFTGESWKKAGKPVIELPTTEYVGGKKVTVKRPFRSYTTWADSMRDYARLLTTATRYGPVVAAARRGDAEGTFDALGKSGYATDPKYGGKLVAVYRAVKTYLV